MHEKKARVAVLVSGGGTNLQAILDAQRSGVIRHAQVALVISNKADAYALERARLAGVPSLVILRKDHGSQEAFEAAVAEALDAASIDLIVLAGFLAILSPWFTDRYRDRIINVHPSLIPSFCGAGYYGLRVHEAALARGVRLTGATVHFVNEIPDGGRIIAQKAVEVRAGDTPEVLQRRVMEQAEWIILPESVEQISQDIIARKEEEE